MSTPQEFRRVADELAQLRTAIEALAAEWEADASHNKDRAERVSGDRRQPYLTNAAFYETHARRLRALLDAR